MAEAMPWLLPLGTGVLFAVWHSFSDAFAWRIFTAWYSPRRKQIAEKLPFILYHSSRCEFCEAKVPWYGLIPVIGYFILKRKCANCGRNISLRFPVFELAAFLYGVAIGLQMPEPGEFGTILLSYALIWIVITVDYHVLLIPTEAILGLLVLGLFNLLVFRYPDWYRLNDINLGLDLAIAFVWYALFHLLRILSGYRMGLADVRLVFALGFLLGSPRALVLPGLAAFLGIGFYLLRRRSILIYAPSETQIPFGVFLGAGYLLLSLMSRIG